MVSDQNVDFDELRKQRNEQVVAAIKRMAKKLGVKPDSIMTTFNPEACYCACSSGGPCEHIWDGKPYESDEGGYFVSSVTCSRCGKTAFNHFLRDL